MSATLIIKRSFSPIAYLDWEMDQLEKHEFHNGKLITMPGGKINHNAISMNMGTAFNIQLNKTEKDCLVLSSDMKIWIPETSSFVYPDVSMVCGEPAFFEERKDVLTNPILIVEVLSESTEGYDRGEKFRKYSSIPSFQEYLVVSQDEALVESFFLSDKNENLWKITRADGIEASLHIHSLNLDLPLSDIYKRIEFEDADQAEIEETEEKEKKE